MAIDTLDKLVSALAGQQKFDIYMTSMTAEGAATWQSNLLNPSILPLAGSTPANVSGIICYHTTSGALGLGVGGITWANTSYLLQAVISGATIGKLIIYDRLWHCAGLNGTTTASVAICTTLDIPRPNSTSGAAGVEMWGEIYNPIGATASTLTVRYQNELGTSGRSATYSHPANAESTGQMFPIVLQAGDAGVQIVMRYSWSATTGTAGNWGITLLRRLAEIPMTNINVGYAMDFAELGMPTVYSSAMIALMVLCSATSTGVIQGQIRLGNG